MSATYDPLHPAAKDRIRAALGDTAVGEDGHTIPDEDAHHTDEHIEAMIAAYGEALALAELAHELWARYAQDPQRISLTGLSVDLSAQLDVWSALATPWLEHLQEQAELAAAGALIPADQRVRPTAFTLACGRRGR